MTRKVLLIGLQLVIVVYLTICGFFFFVQDDILFKPSRLDRDFAYTYPFEFEEFFFEVDEGVELNAILAKADSSHGLIFFCHGNAGSLNTDPLKFTTFLDLGYDVFYFDYRGYGKSDGYIANEEQLISDTDILYREMLKRYPEDQITILGYSLGSGIASGLARRHDPRNLMIWTPYYSMVDMKNLRYPFLPDFLMKFPLKTNENIQAVDEPVAIFYAELDEVLPVDRALALNEYLKDGDEYFILEGQRHGGVYSHPVMLQNLSRLLSKTRE
jgi:hypothetical protein